MFTAYVLRRQFLEKWLPAAAAPRPFAYLDDFSFQNRRTARREPEALTRLTVSRPEALALKRLPVRRPYGVEPYAADWTRFEAFADLQPRADAIEFAARPA